MKDIIAYTDGSAVVAGKNKGNGGFGVYFPNLDGRKVAVSRGYKNTKTGRMEVAALFFAILTVMKVSKRSLTVYSDSEYVVKTFTESRILKWYRNGWRTSGGVTVKNVDLWNQIFCLVYDVDGDKITKIFDIKLKHIKSHQLEKEKDPEKRKELKKNKHIIGNAMADWLADYKRHKILY